MFEKHEIKETQKEEITMSELTTQTVQPEQVVKEVPIVTSNIITIDDLVKVELRVGQIVHVEFVEGSDKLLRLQVDFGDFGKRQIFSGVRKSYQPEDLLNKQAVFVVNLKPRKMMGQESQGMMMCAQDEQGNPKFVGPVIQVPNGTVLQ